MQAVSPFFPTEKQFGGAVTERNCLLVMALASAKRPRRQNVVFWRLGACRGRHAWCCPERNTREISCDKSGVGLAAGTLVGLAATTTD
jgi:hypothetical protein